MSWIPVARSRRTSRSPVRGVVYLVVVILGLYGWLFLVCLVAAGLAGAIR